MPATLQYERDDTCVLHISGTLLGSEFGNLQNTASVAIDAGVRPRVLAILENFSGFERGADWGEFDMIFSHGNEITKIAIVGDPEWSAQALAFAGAGIRRAPVQFFPTGEEAQAREWLAE
jgi:hypothetical protein